MVSFLRSKIEIGQVYPKCFYMTEIHTKPNPVNANMPPDPARKSFDLNSPNPSPMRTSEPPAVDIESQPTSGEGYEVVDQQTIHNHTCNTEISSVDIQVLLKGEDALLEKYNRFKFSRENKNARECPQCRAFQIGQPDVTPQIVCQDCGTRFCFFHSNAHDFDRFPTCEDYEKSIAAELQPSVDFLRSLSKPCPACGVMVMKSGGCNHMKCQCGAAFCWLCGKQIEDTIFPAHFQWWNPTGCSNLQVLPPRHPSPLPPLLAHDIPSLCR